MSAIFIMRKRGCLHFDTLLWHSELLGLHLSKLSLTHHFRNYLCTQCWLIYSQHVSCVSRASWRVCRTCRACRRACSNMAENEEAVVLACTSLVISALDLNQSQEQRQEKVKRTCPPQSTLVRRPWTHVVRVAPCCPDKRDTYILSRHVPTFPYPYAKTHGLDR